MYKKKIRIGMVCYPTYGGSGVVATELGIQLANRGHEVHFIAYEVPFRLPLDRKNLFFHPVETSHYDLFRYPDYALTLAVKMAEIARLHRLDLFHVHYAIPHATSALLAKHLLGKDSPAVITTLHGTDVTLVGRDPAYYELVKFSIEQSCGVTAVSHSLQAQTQELFKTNKEIQVIHNFVSSYAIKKKKNKLLVHASNFRPLKCVPDVVRIFEYVRKKTACKLALVGDGPCLEEVRKEVHARGLSGDVIFHGQTSRADEIVADGDVFLLPSSQESFGLAALEAMAHGVPVVASHVGGLPEVVQHGVTGYLAPCGDVEGMAEFAIAILTDSRLAFKLGRAAQQRSRELFSAEKIISEYEAYYHHVLDK